MELLAGCQDLAELNGKVNGAAFWQVPEAALSETPLEPQAKP